VKRIGLLGGMSWESTALYYQLLNKGIAERLGSLHSADVAMISVDFAPIAQLQAEGRWDEAGDLLAGRARELQSAGADMVLLCTNTMHKVAAQVQSAIDIPLLHIVDVTAAAARHAGVTRVGLVATRFTMEQPFYRDLMMSHGFEVLVPDEPGRDLVHRVIYDELCRGIFTDTSRGQVRAVIEDLVVRGAEGVVLGCTEIELLITQDDCSVAVLPTTALHVAAAIDAALL
jgi:aspartate racemase